MYFTFLLQIFLLFSRDFLTQELGYLIDCSVLIIFSISGMKGCDLRINFLNVLLFVLFNYRIFKAQYKYFLAVSQSSIKFLYLCCN